MVKNRNIIIITNRKDAILGSIERVLKSKFKVKALFNNEPSVIDLLLNNILLLGIDSLNSSKSKKILNLTKISSAPILVLDSFIENENNKEIIQDLLKLLPKNADLIFNIDNKLIKEICGNTKVSNFTFGFEERADFKASDVHINGGLNFKLNYNGKIIPMWQNHSSNDYAYGALVASCIGIILDFNLVEISELLKKD